MSEPSSNRPAHLQLLAVSWNFGWPVAAGVALGHWLDERLGSSPAATLVFGIGAMAAATWRLLSLSKQDAAERREEEAHAGHQDEEGGP
jgi:F0F1-type ATP synthase assembly protein I